MNPRRFPWTMALLAILLLGGVTLNIGSGAVAIAPAQIVAVFLNKMGVATALDVSPVQASVLWSIRLPRVLMAVFVGAALAASGVALQSVFRNPLAEPSLLGMSGGAVVAAMIVAIVQGGLKGPQAGAWAVALGGFVGALAVAGALHLFFRAFPRRDTTTFVLIGVIINVIWSAVMTLLPPLFRQSGLGSDASFWTMGSLGGTLWPSVYIVAPLVMGAGAGLWRLAPTLNILALSDDDAQYLGVSTDAVRWQTIISVSLLSGTAVAFVGVIAFVGLIVPHALRLVLGPDHRQLLPAAALAGGLFVTVADLLARTLASPAELPIGVLTTLAGGPMFFWLLYLERSQKRWGLT